MAEKDNTDFSIIILAAGLGKRMMNPELPKVLAKANGIALIDYVLNQSTELIPHKIVLIVGHFKEKVIKHLDYLDNIEFVEQKEQLGTGHAVIQAAGNFNGYGGDILILCGDVPLLRRITLQNFINNHIMEKADVSVLTADAHDPTGYGRIIRNESGNFIKIVEHKDADDAQKLITEFNSGVYFVKSELLFSALDGISNNNSQNEYYLTDIIEILRNMDKKVVAYKGAEFDELIGVNTPEDLKKVENIINSRKYI